MYTPIHEEINRRLRIRAIGYDIAGAYDMVSGNASRFGFRTHRLRCLQITVGAAKYQHWLLYDAQIAHTHGATGLTARGRDSAPPTKNNNTPPIRTLADIHNNLVYL